MTLIKPEHMCYNFSVAFRALSSSHTDITICWLMSGLIRSGSGNISPGEGLAFVPFFLRKRIPFCDVCGLPVPIINKLRDDFSEVLEVVEKRKVLFLCTGNSARSQMAEAIVNARLGDEWQAVSAGTKPAGFVHPRAIRVLEEIGIYHQGSSKGAEEFRDESLDLVVTVCDSAAEECPLWLGKGTRVHLGFPDPAKTTGTDEEVLQSFRQVRDQIAESIPALLRGSVKR